MKLNQLFSFFKSSQSLATHSHLLEQDVSGVYQDARLVRPQSVFIAIQGHEKDGHQFISQAVQNGAMALVVENESTVPKDFQGLVYVVKNSREMLDLLAARFYKFPSHELICIGVTGTNGKTSITYLLEHMLNEARKTTGVIGTVNNRVKNKVWPTINTTPDALTLQSRLRDFVDEGATCAALEVTSHALEQKRVDSVQFNTVIFTNLTLDHLDYHKTMENYFAAKQKLFTDLMILSLKHPKFAIVNVDDSYGRKLKVSDEVIVWTYGQRESDFQFKVLHMNYKETKIRLKTSVETLEFLVPLSGHHMISNAVAALAAVVSCGVPMATAIKSLEQFSGIPGRLQLVVTEDSTKPAVFVDYAHSPDALENVLLSLNLVRKENNLKNTKIITVFGCGGDRDKSKRPIMGQVAVNKSDYAFVTSDNPRTEKPSEIINDVIQGLKDFSGRYSVIEDREQAIAAAIKMAGPYDVVLIAGKGHEDYQIIGTTKNHFSDFEVAEKYLKSKEA